MGCFGSKPVHSSPRLLRRAVYLGAGKRPGSKMDLTRAACRAAAARHTGSARVTNLLLLGVMIRLLCGGINARQHNGRINKSNNDSIDPKGVMENMLSIPSKESVSELRCDMMRSALSYTLHVSVIWSTHFSVARESVHPSHVERPRPTKNTKTEESISSLLCFSSSVAQRSYHTITSWPNLIY